mgnify:CR=1 FL=1
MEGNEKSKTFGSSPQECDKYVRDTVGKVSSFLLQLRSSDNIQKLINLLFRLHSQIPSLIWRCVSKKVPTNYEKRTLKVEGGRVSDPFSRLATRVPRSDGVSQ